MEKERVKVSSRVFEPVRAAAKKASYPSRYTFGGRLAMLVFIEDIEFVSGLKCLGLTSIGIITGIDGRDLSVWSYEDMAGEDLEEISNRFFS